MFLQHFYALTIHVEYIILSLFFLKANKTELEIYTRKLEPPSPWRSHLMAPLGVIFPEMHWSFHQGKAPYVDH